jgi:hypothetical protein
MGGSGILSPDIVRDLLGKHGDYGLVERSPHRRQVRIQGKDWITATTTGPCSWKNSYVALIVRARKSSADSPRARKYDFVWTMRSSQISAMSTASAEYFDSKYV